MSNKDNAIEQAAAQFASVCEMVEALKAAADDDNAREEAQARINEDALSVEVRSGWYSFGPDADTKPAEYRILLCTGGPAVQIVGELDVDGQPTTAKIQYQDWFTPWNDWTPAFVTGGSVEEISAKLEAMRETLLAYARQFYFGE